MSRTAAIEHLIKVIEDSSDGSNFQLVAIEALGEAGGNQAINYLIKFAGEVKGSGNSHFAALKALGRASRNVE